MESVVNKQVEGQTVDCKLFRLYNIHSFLLQFKKIIFSTLLALRDKTEENGKQGKREKKRKTAGTRVHTTKCYVFRLLIIANSTEQD